MYNILVDRISIIYIFMLDKEMCMEKIKEFVHKHANKIAWLIVVIVIVIALASCQGLVPLNDSSGNTIVVGHDQNVMEVC